MAMKVRSRSYSVVPPTSTPSIIEAAYLVYTDNGSEVEITLITADGQSVFEDFGQSLQVSDNIGRSIFAPAGELGRGSRVAVNDGRVEVLDFENGNIYSYTPTAPWEAGPPMLVGVSVFWLEFVSGGAGDAVDVRLRSSDLLLSTVVTVRTQTMLNNRAIFVGEWGRGSFPTGAEFTDDLALMWIPFTDIQVETANWLRVLFPLDGSAASTMSAPGFGGSPPEVVRELAGIPISATDSLTVDQQGVVRTWAGPNPDDLYTAWGDEPTVIDIALSHDRTTVHFLTTGAILVYDLATRTLIATVPMPVGNPMGLHVLAEPIPFVEDPDEEE